MSFFATLSYELDPLTPPAARKLLRAELVGRRWNDRYEGHLMPSGSLWIKRSAGPGETVDDLTRICERELNEAIAGVRSAGLKLALVRGWVQISGAGTWGIILPPSDAER